MAEKELILRSAFEESAAFEHGYKGPKSRSLGDLLGLDMVVQTARLSGMIEPREAEKAVCISLRQFLEDTMESAADRRPAARGGLCSA